jgi:SPP1 family phage portal protein
MIQYYLNRDRELTTDVLGTILQSFQSGVVATLKKRYNYYIGKQDILLRVPSSEEKPNNRIVTNFVKNIVDTYEGYAVGVPVTYDSEIKGFEELDDMLKYNDVVNEDAEFFRKGLIFGRAPEICYFDEDGKPRFKTLSPLECLPIYDDTLNNDLLYAVRFWADNVADGLNPTYWVEVYDDIYRTLYRSSSGFSSFELTEKAPHKFDQVPITFFSLNEEEEGIADCIFSLQDAYNSLLSDSLNDWDSFCDAYLMLVGCEADAEDLQTMKTQRCLSLPEGGSASFLIKNTQTTEIEHLLTTVEEKIREIASCPNFASETFGTSSGIAIRYRLMGMSNRIKSIEANFKKALQRRIELLAGVSKMINGSEALWRDVGIDFTDNVPQNLADIASEINAYRGLVSDRTLLTQVPFVTDVDEELEQLKKEKAESVEIYQGFTVEEEEDEDGDTQV